MQYGYAASIILLLTLGLPALAQDWPSFRGPAGSGVADGQDLPVEFSAEDDHSILWKTPVPGLAHSSPIVSGDRIYLTTVVQLDGSPEIKIGRVSGGLLADDSIFRHNWLLYALDRASGEILWEKVVAEGVPRTKRHIKSTHASSTPVTNGKYVVTLLDSEGLFCYGRDGELQWSKDLGLIDAGYVAEPSLQWGPASSPVIYRNQVIVQVDHNGQSFLASYELESGAEVWKVERDEKPAWSTPVIYIGERDELITNSANFFYGYNPSTGREYWRYSNEDNQVIIPSPVLAGDSVILTGGASRYTRPITALKLGSVSGQQASQELPESRLLWRVERSSPYTPTPLAYRGLLYVITDHGILSTYALESGKRIYRTRVQVGANFSASPVASDGKIYFASEDGDVYVVRAGREYELLATNPIGEILMATPAISDSTLFIRGRNHLYAIGAAPQEKTARSSSPR